MKTMTVHTIPLEVLGTVIVERIDFDDGATVYRWEVRDDDGSVLSFHDWEYPSDVAALRAALNHSDHVVQGEL